MELDMTCNVFPKGVDATATSASGVTIRDLPVQKGYWRAGLYSKDLLQCPAPDACKGSRSSAGKVSVDDVYCEVGNMGTLCAICAEGFKRLSQSKLCTECGAAGLAILYAILAMFGFLLGVGVAVLINRKAPSGMVRPFINLVQQMTVMLMFRSDWPSGLVQAMLLLQGLNLGLEVVLPQCTGLGNSYYGRFFVRVCVHMSVCVCAYMCVCVCVCE